MLPVTKKYLNAKNIKRGILGILVILLLVVVGEPTLFSETAAGLNTAESAEGDEFLIYSDSTAYIEKESDQDAPLTGSIIPLNNKSVSTETKYQDMWTVGLQKYLENRGSPTAPYANLYVEYAQQYNVPVVLMPAVAEAETHSCTHREPGVAVAPSSIQKNCWGIGGGPKTRTKFSDWDSAIKRAIEIIAEGYGQGTISLTNMQRNYCGAGCPDDVWARRVLHYVDEINDFVEGYGAQRDTSVTL